ncbi:Uncharacterized protein dnm_094960 [Desulfonema magnum]|uniref:Uncharacterized protein n=1 Tax=Desulfonema magnum TaxID=45655 RepID=A0A975BXD6_9BACT|nr:Uncharacterized protein dnm_094960 [Desulfonema magnum]
MKFDNVTPRVIGGIPVIQGTQYLFPDKEKPDRKLRPNK